MIGQCVPQLTDLAVVVRCQGDHRSIGGHGGVSEEADGAVRVASCHHPLARQVALGLEVGRSLTREERERGVCVLGVCVCVIHDVQGQGLGLIYRMASQGGQSVTCTRKSFMMFKG